MSSYRPSSYSSSRRYTAAQLTTLHLLHRRRHHPPPVLPPPSRPIGNARPRPTPSLLLLLLAQVWQLSQQFPTAFEFNASYLAALIDASLCGASGTFLANCERQREPLAASTASAWEALDIAAHRNPDYAHTDAVLHPLCSACQAHTHCMRTACALHVHCMCTSAHAACPLPAPCLPPAYPRPLHSACQLRLWTAFYCRGGQPLRPDPHVLLEQRCAALAAERDDLRAEIARLRSLPATAAAAPVAAPATAAPATAVAPAATAPAAAAAPPAAAVAPAAAATRAAPAPAPASAAPASAIAPAAPIAVAAPAAPAQPSATAATETATEPVPRVAPPAQEPPAPSDATDGERLAAAEVPP